MKWIKYDHNNCELETDQKIIVALQHFHTKNYRYYEVKKVDEDDCSFRTVDDNSEIGYEWTVTHYMIPETPTT